MALLAAETREQLCNQAAQASFKLSCETPGKSAQSALTQRLLFLRMTEGVATSSPGRLATLSGTSVMTGLGGDAQEANKPAAMAAKSRRKGKRFALRGG
jgi:hypothetical protein